MAKSAHAVCPCGFTRLARPRAANTACASLLRATKPGERSRRIEVSSSKQDPDSLSVSTQEQPVPVTPEDLKTYKKRRWSNLSGELIHQPGTVIGSATLIAGTTIGASHAHVSIKMLESLIMRTPLLLLCVSRKCRAPNLLLSTQVLEF